MTENPTPPSPSPMDESSGIGPGDISPATIQLLESRINSVAKQLSVLMVETSDQMARAWDQIRILEVSLGKLQSWIRSLEQKDGNIISVAQRVTEMNVQLQDALKELKTMGEFQGKAAQIYAEAEAKKERQFQTEDLDF